MTTEKISSLESRLSDLRDHLKTTVFDQSELERMQIMKRAKIPKTQRFSYPGLGPLMLDFQKKFVEGWTYDMGFQNQNSPRYTPGFTASINLNIPAPAMANKYAESDRSVEQEYIESIDSERNQLMTELAAASLELAEAKADAREQNRKQKAFEQELEKIRKEFLVEAPESEDNQDEKPTEDNNGSAQ